VRELVREHSAIVLGEDKEYLVEARLTSLLPDVGARSVQDLVLLMRREAYGTLHKKVVDAMTTNETSFFRDIHPFETLKKVVLPELIAKRSATKTLSIWSAASSTGQEPYSIAITLREHFPELASWNVRILATDLSERVLTKARSGKYTRLEVGRGLPATLWVKYFQPAGLDWEVKPEIRALIEFTPLNLIERWSVAPMDVIFCRNVLIYFDVEVKKAILERMRGTLRPDGYLFLGTAESTIGLDGQLERVGVDKSACYRLKTGTAV